MHYKYEVRDCDWCLELEFVSDMTVGSWQMKSVMVDSGADVTNTTACSTGTTYQQQGIGLGWYSMETGRLVLKHAGRE